MRLVTTCRQLALGLAVTMIFPLAAWAGNTPQTVDGAAIAAPPAGEWLSYGRDYSEQRFSPLEQINTESVKTLGLAWSLDVFTNRGVEATPLYADGVLYASLPWSDVVAVDARTGKQLWRYDAKVPRAWGYNACCDVVNRGVAMWQGRLFVGTLDGRLVALDAKTGKTLFDVSTIDKKRPFTITGAPRVIKGRVLIGNGGAEYGVRGYISAYDAMTGKLAWRFHTVPGNPAKGFENQAMADAAKTWTGEWWKVGGGGTVWDSVAYDPALNLIYFGTGNGSAWSKYVRSPGGGDNLYLCSILAVDADTGAYKWHYQNTPGDTWDYDSNQHLLLTDLTIEGKSRSVLLQANKNGYFYVLDRKTGELISADAYSTVTWASGIDKATGKPIQTAEGQWDKKPALVMPPPLGAHNWQPMSFNPKTGLVYIPTQNFPAGFEKDENYKYRPGEWNMGMDLSKTTDAPPEYFSGALTAWDPVARKEAWKVPLWGHWNGGTLTTAGNLVFQGTGNGKFVAYSADKGEKLWEAPAGSGIIAAPMTFEMDGQQYVTVMAGWGGVGSMVYGRAAKAAGVKSIGRMLTFKIGATAQLAANPAPDAIPTPPKSTASLSVIKAGEGLYHTHCVACHGIGVVGGGMIPDLRYLDAAKHAAWDDIVRGGLLKDSGMVGFDKKLSKPVTDAIHAYIIHRANEADIPKPIEAKAAAIK